MRASIVLALLTALSTFGCAETTSVVPTPSPAPVYDAEIYRRACDNLALLGCPEGKDADCVATFERAQGKVVDLRPLDLAAARSVEEVRAVGTASCASPVPQ